MDAGLFPPPSQTRNQLLQLFIRPRPVQRVKTRESPDKSAQFRQTGQTIPVGLMSWVTSCCFLNVGQISLPLRFFASQQRFSGANGVEAFQLETEAGLFISWVNICRLEKKKKKTDESEDGEKE